MKGFNTKIRYEVKMMLSVAALALCYNSPGWSFVLSGGASYWLGYQGKHDSIKNIWWITVSSIACGISLLTCIATNMAPYYVILSVDKCILLQQCLAGILIASMISSTIVSETSTNTTSTTTSTTITSSSSEPTKTN